MLSLDPGNSPTLKKLNVPWGISIEDSRTAIELMRETDMQDVTKPAGQLRKTEAGLKALGRRWGRLLTLDIISSGCRIFDLTTSARSARHAQTPT
jgi:hypothetical protein